MKQGVIIWYFRAVMCLPFCSVPVCVVIENQNVMLFPFLCHTFFMAIACRYSRPHHSYWRRSTRIGPAKWDTAYFNTTETFVLQTSFMSPRLRYAGPHLRPWKYIYILYWNDKALNVVSQTDNSHRFLTHNCRIKID